MEPGINTREVVFLFSDCCQCFWGLWELAKRLKAPQFSQVHTGQEKGRYKLTCKIFQDNVSIGGHFLFCHICHKAPWRISLTILDIIAMPNTVAACLAYSQVDESRRCRSSTLALQGAHWPLQCGGHVPVLQDEGHWEPPPEFSLCSWADGWIIWSFVGAMFWQVRSKEF